MDYDREQLKLVEDEIKQIQNSDEYQNLKLFFTWGKLPKATDKLNETQKKAAVKLLKFTERLDELRTEREQWHQTIQSANKPKASAKKQIAYKKMSVEASGRKYLDAVATKLNFFYNFVKTYKQPTMGDVLEAIRTGQWNHRLDYRNEPEIEPGLPDIFTPQQWDLLRKFNTEINDHDGTLPQASNQKPYVIIADGNFHKDFIQDLQQIAAITHLVHTPDDLLVKNEKELSGVSGSYTFKA